MLFTLIQNNMKILFLIHYMCTLMVIWKADGLITVSELNNKENFHDSCLNFVMNLISWDWNEMKICALLVHSHIQFVTDCIVKLDWIKCTWWQIQIMQMQKFKDISQWDVCVGTLIDFLKLSEERKKSTACVWCVLMLLLPLLAGR
jgi:hypothetical protein